MQRKDTTIRRTALIFVMALALGALIPVSAGAQQPAAAAGEGEGAELAKKLSNPISDLVSVPFQLNWEQGVGPNDQTRFILNVQPVMPFTLNADWNMITRVIMPFVSQPPLAAGGAPAFGISDLTTSFFFSPTRVSKFVLGVGPVFTLPSTTQPTIGSEKWAIGPTIIILKQSGPWTYGALWNQLWSYAGNSSRDDVNQMFLQPFLAYNTKSLVTFTLQSESSANWDADDQWTIPINVIVSKISSFGAFPASYFVGLGVFAASPEVGGADWKLRAGVTVLMPRRK